MSFNMSGNRRAAMSDINVTPLVDVMLVLLIIFMVTAPMMKEGVSVDIPEAEGKPIDTKPNVEAIVISVTASGTIDVDGDPVTIDQLTDRIKADVKSNPERDVNLRAGKNVPYGVVVRIMAKLRNAGIANLGMITKPEEKPADKR